MADTKPPKPGDEPDDIEAPRLTPQGRDAPEGEDETDPMGGAKTGQADKAEGGDETDRAAAKMDERDQRI